MEAADLQGRFNREQLFSCEEVIERYQTKSARKFVRKLWKEEKPSVQERWEMAHKMFRELYELELLREDWDMLSDGERRTSVFTWSRCV